MGLFLTKMFSHQTHNNNFFRERERESKRFAIFACPAVRLPAEALARGSGTQPGGRSQGCAAGDLRFLIFYARGASALGGDLRFFYFNNFFI